MTSTSVTRRRFLASSLATATALRFAPRAFALPGDACLLTAEQEVGPFYVADESLRSAIAEGKPGVPLHVRLVVVDQTSCLPIPHAAVDLWHCDAMGLYSGFTASSGFGPPGGGPGGGPGGPPPGFDPRHGPPGGGGPEGGGPEDGGPHGPPPASKPTDKFTFLRGVQMTDNEGAVSFQTIFPGFYQGRTNHIHFKVRLGGHRSGKTYAGGHVSHTGQLFFPEDLNLRLMAETPYRAHSIERTTMAEDHVYNDEHGSMGLASVRLLDPAHPDRGFVAELRTAVDPHATPAAAEGNFPPRS